MPDGDRLSDDENSQHRSLNRCQHLCDEEYSMTSEPIRQHTGKRYQKKQRNVADKSDHSQHQLRFGEPIDQPAHRDLLHPGTDKRYRLSEKEQAEISRAQRAHEELEIV